MGEFPILVYKQKSRDCETVKIPLWNGIISHYDSCGVTWALDAVYRVARMDMVANAVCSRLWSTESFLASLPGRTLDHDASTIAEGHITNFTQRHFIM